MHTHTHTHTHTSLSLQNACTAFGSKRGYAFYLIRRKGKLVLQLPLSGKSGLSKSPGNGNLASISPYQSNRRHSKRSLILILIKDTNVLLTWVFLTVTLNRGWEDEVGWSHRWHKENCCNASCGLGSRELWKRPEQQEDHLKRNVAFFEVGQTNAGRSRSRESTSSFHLMTLL